MKLRLFSEGYFDKLHEISIKYTPPIHNQYWSIHYAEEKDWEKEIFETFTENRTRNCNKMMNNVHLTQTDTHTCYIIISNSMILINVGSDFFFLLLHTRKKQKKTLVSLSTVRCNECSTSNNRCRWYKTTPFYCTSGTIHDYRDGDGDGVGERVSNEDKMEYEMWCHWFLCQRFSCSITSDVWAQIFAHPSTEA